MNQQTIDIIIRAKDEATSTLKGIQGLAWWLVNPLKTVAKVWVAAFGAVSVAAYKWKEAIEQDEQAQFRLTKLLKTASKASNWQVNSLLWQADALEKTTVAGKDMIMTTQSQLSTFNLNADTIEKLTPSILDYVVAEKWASASADDYRQMTNGLAQALNGNFASLTKSGFVLDEHTKNLIKNGNESERAAALVKVLDGTYKGFAEWATTTSIWKQIMLGKAIEDVNKAIAEIIIPTIDKFKWKILDLALVILDWITKNKDQIKGYVDFFVNKFIELGDLLIPILKGILSDLTIFWQEHGDTVLEILGNFWEIAVGLVKLGGELLSGALKILFGILTLDWKWAWEGIQKIVTGVFDFIVAYIKAVFGVDITQYIGDVLFWFETMFTNTFTAISNFVTEKIDWMKNKAKEAADFLRSIMAGYEQSKVWQAMGNAGAAVYDTIHGTRATGGTMMSNQPYLVGERGKEVVIPKSASTVIPANEVKWGGTNISINFGWVSVRNDADIRAIASAVESSITRKMQLYRQGIAA